MRENGVAGIVVAVELVGLAVLLQGRLGLVDVVRGRVAVLVAEQAHERRLDALGEVDRGDRLFRGQRRFVDDDVAAPAIDRGVDAAAEPAGAEVGLAAARAEADDADLAGRVALLAQEGDRAGDVADDLVVGVAAVAAHLGDHRLVGAVADPAIEARRDRGIAVMGEFARDFAGPLVPAGHVMDDDDAREWAIALRAGVVGFALVLIVPGVG